MTAIAARKSAPQLIQDLELLGAFQISTAIMAINSGKPVSRVSVQSPTVAPHSSVQRSRWVRTLPRKAQMAIANRKKNRFSLYGWDAVFTRTG